MLMIARDGSNLDLLEQSIIIIAHPDDEVLWFSSILDKVNQVVVCFLNHADFPHWRVGRQKSLTEYPIKNITCLNIDESGVFNGADWENPVATEYGIEIVGERIRPQWKDAYKSNYDELKQQLEKQLDGYRYVFTHNPWGEYGHEEHVQVHRVVKDLQAQMKFSLWYSNYVSNKSFKLMVSHVERFCFESVAFRTNRDLTADVMNLYKRNNCWTWFDDWKCFTEEVFLKERDFEEGEERPGRLFPTNLIRLNPPAPRTQQPPPLYSYSGISGRVKTRFRETLRRVGLEITRYTPDPYERKISLKPEKPSQGDVLFSFLVDPFLLKPDDPIFNSHTHYWECLQIARIFLDLGYAVDVIDSHNQTFRPGKRYSFFVGHRINFDRVADSLKKSGCVKIAHLDTAHWIFNNHSTYQRKFELQRRRGVAIKESHRIIEPNQAIENADHAVMYGNQFTLDTFRYAHKPLFQVPISTCAIVPWPENKDYSACRSNFLWFGSGGFVHKGLDLVLEAFAEMPNYHLYVCGPLPRERDFVQAYYKELYETPNIHAVGWVDVDGPEFRGIANKCLGVVYPSCSEGQSGSVVACLHAGLIPIISYESGVNVDGFGVILEDHTIKTIKEAVQMVSDLSGEQLQHMARTALEYARANHTREKFAEAYKRIILNICQNGQR
jgi:glycosyltransferase involved in cell wall biosynthesis